MNQEQWLWSTQQRRQLQHNKVSLSMKRNQKAKSIVAKASVKAISCFSSVRRQDNLQPQRAQTNLRWVVKNTRLWLSACLPCSLKKQKKWETLMKMALNASTWQTILGRPLLARLLRILNLNLRLQPRPCRPWQLINPPRSSHLRWCSEKHNLTISLQWMTR